MRIINIFIFILFAGSGYCQEQLLDLQYNPVVKDELRRENMMNFKSSPDDTIPVPVPFFDDFSKNRVFPSAERWIDRYGFENNDWPINPVNLGAVTLDAINDSGNMYPNAVPGPETFIADQLTSRYIRLDSVFTPTPRVLTPADSVYFSFLYQPQGRGSAPKTHDSLILQFLVKPARDSITPTDTIHLDDEWERIWSTPGMALDTFYLKYNTYFKRVQILIKDTVFFKKTFRFRFYNHASLASNIDPSWQSNCCQWNIDNIYLNTNRSWKDTVYSEIRFIERPPSMLSKYQAMPYSQYIDNPTEEMIDTISVTFRNQDSVNHTVSYKYQVTFPDGNNIKTYTLKNDTLVRPYPRYNEMTLRPPVQFLFPILPSADSAEFVMKHMIKDSQPGSLFGDTISAIQKFYNYFAYDDGTPERGYGVTKSGSQIAYRFRLNKSPDTLRGVSIYFNKTLSKANLQVFNLTIWDDNNDKPGDTLYSRPVLAQYSDSLNEFVTYRLEVPVRISGTFYVGAITTTDDNLNIGFDRYNNSQDDLLYNSTGQWYSSAYTGSLLMRPLVGKPIPVGIPAPGKKSERIVIFPNPCSTGNINIFTEEFRDPDFQKNQGRLFIRDLFGKEIISCEYHNNIDVSRLAPGLYIIGIIFHETGKLYTGKLIVTK